METNEIHRGRLVDHVELVVADIQACKRFYRAVLEVLGEIGRASCRERV